jgi:hypothetical protein
MITFKRLSHRSSINSASNVRSSASRFINSRYMSTSRYRLYIKCRGRSSSNKSKSGGNSGGRMKMRMRMRSSSSRILTTGIIVAGTVAGRLDGSG